MPFKSDKQRKWMHANEPDMAKKWEKEESINEASYKVNHAEFDHIVQLLMVPELWGDNLKGKKQGFGGIKRSYQKLSKEFYKHGIKGIGKLFKTYHKLPNKTKLFSNEDFWEKWLNRQGYRVVFESVNETSIEESIREKIRGIIKRELEATTTTVVPPHDTPQAYSKSTQTAIDIDDEDDEKNESTKEYGKTLDKIAKDRQLKSISKKDRDILIKISKLMKRANESMVAPFRRRNSRGLGRVMKTEFVNEARLVGYDKSYLDNAKKRLKVPHEITKIEYKQTRYRGPHDKFVRIWFKLKWKPGIRFDPEEKWVSVFYDSPERLKMIGKKLKLKLKESVNEDNIKFSKEEMAQLHKDGKVEKNGHTIEFSESINEKIAKPYSNHLRKAQEEIEYMISNGPTPDGDDGVYDRPNQAMKLLQIAQKSLGKIK